MTVLMLQTTTQVNHDHDRPYIRQSTTKNIFVAAVPLGLLLAYCSLPQNLKTRKEKKKDYDGQLLIKQYRLIDMSDEAEVYVPPTSSNMLAPSSGDDADIYVDPYQTNDATIVSQLAKQGFPKGASLC